MPYAWCVGLTPTKNPPSSQTTRSHPGKERPINQRLWIKQCCLEEKEKYNYITHPAEDHTNFHLHYNQKEKMGTWEKEETHTRSKKK